MQTLVGEEKRDDDVFFVFDSDSIDQIRSKLYGYVIDEAGVHTDMYSGDLKGIGCYIRILVENNCIHVEQDSNGSFGLYLYQHGSYFALSNSFFRLQDFLKTRVTLSANMEYIYQFLALDLCSLAYEETAINEIKWLDKDAEVLIDKVGGRVNIIVHTADTNTVTLDSREGCAILDLWFSRWSRIIKALTSCTKNVSVDLSGGFDSRLSFLLVMMSGCDLNSICVNSVLSSNKVHQVDYQIASQIADRFGFSLNNTLSPDNTTCNYSMEEVLDLVFDTKMTFHQKASLITKRRSHALFKFTGTGGELIRSYWDKNIEDFILYKKTMAYRLGNRLSLRIFNSMQKIITRSMTHICDKYGISMRSSVAGHYLYKETRCRNHFGRMMAEGAASGIYYVSPLMDRDLHRLKLNFSGMSDKNALLALIFVRYCPELLDFPFEGGRSLDESTIRIARSVCERFVYEPNAFSEASNLRFDIPQTDVKCNKNAPLSETAIDDYLKRVVDAPRVKDMITQTLGKEVYQWAVSKNNEKGFMPSKPWHAILGVVKALDNVELSQRNHESCKVSLDRFYSGTQGFGDGVEEELGENDIRILAFRDNKYNWLSVGNDCLQSGFEYEFSADKVVVEEGEASLVEVLVYESTQRKFCLRKKFPVSAPMVWRFVVPAIEGKYRLLVYAGEAGKTQGIGVVYRNVKVVAVG